MPIYFSLIEKLKTDNVLEPVPDADLAAFSLSVYRVAFNSKYVAVLTREWEHRGPQPCWSCLSDWGVENLLPVVQPVYYVQT